MGTYYDYYVFHFFHSQPTTFSIARHKAIRNGIMLRRIVEFEPAKLAAEDVDYSAVQQVWKKLKKNFTLV